ncbi:hypothetical protein SAMN04488502_1014 [Dendrosporobacter quercicolus]|uniref:Rubrerythrin n=1 Tax=Dendrosporobacter quercicolus TaxID=146817 RepID=A0A1G9KEM7_9FIRM|nr:hypothetical protein [Dendrosporobacter quercicolus]SDL47815.1 hypothetical protein SAMN04488502_1014 [Dendrosporobacter quercicolus]
MSNETFSDLEGLRIAIEIEARGCEFYQQAYEKAQKAEHKDTFILLKMRKFIIRRSLPRSLIN